MADHAAQVNEMLLRGGAFFQVRLLPLGYELGNCHGVPPQVSAADYSRMLRDCEL
jgi:hypothetical protein